MPDDIVGEQVHQRSDVAALLGFRKPADDFCVRAACRTQFVSTLNNRASGGPFALPARWFSSFGRTTCAAELAFSCVSQRTKMPYSPSLSSPKTVTPWQPGCDAINGAMLSAIAWASACFPAPNENLTSLAYMATLRGA